jgi:hypothetical protein
MGYKKHNGRWMTDSQISAQKAEIEEQQKADKKYRLLLEKWKTWLGEKEKRAETEQLLAGLHDPRAVPSIWAVFANGAAGAQVRAVQLFGQIDSPGASKALALLAIFGKSDDVRRTALETLKRRDARDFLDLWIGLIRRPYKYEVRPVNGPGSAGVLFVDGEQFNVQRFYTAPALPPVTYAILDQIQTGMFVTLSPSEVVVEYRRPKPGEPATERLESISTAPEALFQRESQFAQIMASYQLAAASSQQRLQNDVAAIEAMNAQINGLNARALQALETMTGQDLGKEKRSWEKWWTDQRGYAYQPPPEKPKPVFQQMVSAPFQPGPVSPAPMVHEVVRRHSCFAGGTLVHTLQGTAPIERLSVGDVVLTQNSRTGELSFQPIVAVYHNAPNATLSVDLGTDTIVATGIHRFWKSGKGWTMARDLKPGDPIRALGATVTVKAVNSDQVQPVYNLEVTEGHSFFVGKQGLLVHDNSLVQPELRPFDAEPTLAAAQEAKAEQ